MHPCGVVEPPQTHFWCWTSRCSTTRSLREVVVRRLLSMWRQDQQCWEFTRTGNASCGASSLPFATRRSCSRIWNVTEPRVFRGSSHNRKKSLLYERAAGATTPQELQVPSRRSLELLKARRPVTCVHYMVRPYLGQIDEV